jgi:hypothetical protein
MGHEGRPGVSGRARKELVEDKGEMDSSDLFKMIHQSSSPGHKQQSEWCGIFRLGDIATHCSDSILHYSQTETTHGT